MKISDALASIQRLYIETAPLIYYVEEHPTYISKMDEIIAFVETKPIVAISSVITLTEVLPLPMRSGNLLLEQEYRTILLHSEGYTLVAVSEQIAETAARFRARYNLRTPDALHIATALIAGCDAFLTNDAALQRVTELRILILDQLEADV